MKTPGRTKKTTATRAARATRAAAPKTPAEPTVLVLRTCNHNMTAYGGFKWPESGPIECPDWDPTPRCGGGLHGTLWGEGNGSLLSWDSEAKWLVVEVLEKDIVQLDGKVKFPRGRVVYCGDRAGATALIQRPGRVVIGATQTTLDDYGTAAAGYRGTATAGYRGTATAGYRGTATAGDYGTAAAGKGGTATAGKGGTATAGDYGTAAAGKGGTATAGDYGTAAAGKGGILEITWWDGARRRRAIGYVGEGGIQADVAYHVVNGKLVRKSTETP